jgi:hypothetical protein
MTSGAAASAPPPISLTPFANPIDFEPGRTLGKTALANAGQVHSLVPPYTE